MRRLLFALTFAAGLWLCPAPAQAGPWGGEPEYSDPTVEEREAEKRAERNAVLFVGVIALLVACLVTYQWGREIRDMSMSLFRRRRPVLVLHSLDELDEYADEDDDF